MIYVNVGDIKDPLKQDLPLEFCGKQHKDISILTESHVSHDQIHLIKNNWLGPIFFSPEDSDTEGLLAPLNFGLEGVSEVDTDPRFASFQITPSNDRFLSAYTPSGHSTRKQLGRGVRGSLKDFKTIWKTKIREERTK